MGISTRPFNQLLEHALAGKLQLPEFQRNYVWTRKQAIELFDSLRLRYPIGSFLLMERNPEVPITPRPFAGSTAARVTPDAFVLDGQQRITAGLALRYGTSGSQYFVDLERLAELGQEADLDLKSPTEIADFMATLDPEDGYMKGKRAGPDPAASITKGLLFTGVLSERAKLRTLRQAYVEQRPERALLWDGIVEDHLANGFELHVPVIEVEHDRPVQAISRIFTTLNTTGQPLNAFELVVAVLYPSGIRLQSDVTESKELFDGYYPRMDKIGEIFLQTIALLANKTPKKSLLPKTIKPEIYSRYRNEAPDLLEKAGAFLTNRLGLGLDHSSDIVPYDSIFAPFALALKHLEGMGLKGADRAEADRKLDKWFIISALDNRYQEGVHNKQERDRADVEAWLQVPGDARAPLWIKDFKVPSLRSASPNGAVGRLLGCLINRQHPEDPVTGSVVGVSPSAVSTERHHIFPKRWVAQYLDDWESGRTCDIALNVTFVSQDTNRRWANVDPANQLTEIRAARHSGQDVRASLGRHLIDDDCIAAMAKPNKRAEDFDAFIQARERAFLRVLKDGWGILPQTGSSPADLIEPEDESPAS